MCTIKIRDSREDITTQHYTQIKINKLYITSQGPRRLEYISSKTQESAEATIYENRHKLNKFALRRLAQKQQRSKRQGLLPGSLLTTPGHRRSPSRGRRRPRCSSRRQRWYLAPGLHHLVATTRKKKEGGKGVAKQL